MRPTIREWMLVLATVGVTGSLLLSAQGRSNCGGNSKALSNVLLYRDLFLERVAPTQPAPTTRIESLVRDAAPETRDDLRSIAQGVWGGHFLVAVEPFRHDDPNPRRVLIVSDQPFQNVPRRTLGNWLNPPTHAAGFADGSIELISTADFTALDRTQFLPLEEVLNQIPPEVTP